ncbi:MAG TPA: 3-oxoacyl-[acyl-carrier-protein] reductase [Candidatus Cloacimonadota bacterium]|nr:3-oxoacyl-[acyl-carrier-protein] reductase [Candidatus Cloacimonadota bacterium]HQB40592.1 3-oxoacyl-[acyl-carrier-protein] reductase [Candidatus Cloacimonadota bacterium]
MVKRFVDRVVVVTGSARGIGFTIAERFAQEGAITIISDISEEAVAEAAKKLQDQGYKADGFVINVTDSSQVEATFKEIVSKYQRIDVLVNNAGITKDTLIMRMKESDWDAVINVNLKGTFNCTQKISRHMLNQRSGSIINIASVIGIMGNVGQSNYAASKAGIIGLTKSTAKEFASRNIRANAIAPGFIETEMTAQLSPEVVENYAKAIPLQKMGKPVDVANACIFLASDEAQYITGQTIQVDGGLIMS